MLLPRRINYKSFVLGPLRIVLRKSCWDSSIDDSLLGEPSTLNLLYIQTVADIERGWIQATEDIKQQLALMQVTQFTKMKKKKKIFSFIYF